ncbi:MAG TPA: sulfotransferase [Terriglobia bacterium]|nr:sulfotransferase [Terriglobia bacterium]
MRTLIRQVSFFLARRALRSLGAAPLPAVFVMGHMRSGSTLLLHILLTHPEIIGCGERNTPYRSSIDLDKLEIASRIAQRAPFRRVRYAIDQINHDKFTPNPDLLGDERLHCIFLIREPKATIQSIVNLSRSYYEPWTVQRAVDYYSQRLRTLAEYATRLGRRNEALALTYNDLVADTSSVLRRMESFLGLSGTLREEYTMQRFTGKRGDPSENIHVGRIVRHSSRPAVQIPDRELSRALHVYDECARALNLDPSACNFGESSPSARI